MKVYADSSRQFAVQLVLDMLFVSWVIFCIWLGVTVHDVTEELAAPGDTAAESATDLSESMTSAGDFLGDVPVVGDGVATPFDAAADASDELAASGRSTARAVERLAFWLGFAIALVPIAMVGSRYLPGRVRFVRYATAGQQFLDSHSDLELFALRAMVHQPLHTLARVSPDPVGAVRRGEQETIAALAHLELSRHGLTAPTIPTGVTR